MEGCGTAVVWSWIHWSAAAPLGCAVLHREPRSASVSLGLRPHSHLGHREKECADLMMYRKSDKPHSEPSAAIGRHCTSESPPTLNSSPLQKACGNIVCGSTHNQCALGHVLHCSTLGLLHFFSHLCRGRGGLSEARQRAGGLKLSARRSIPSRLMGN